MPGRPVALYFDFVSPYSWLALLQAGELGRRLDVCWELRPVVYAALLDAAGLIGPAEADAKRRYTFYDVARWAERLGVRLVGPPTHPFRSLEALRTLCLFLRDPQAEALARALADACWGDGSDLTDVAVLARVVREVGLDNRELAIRIAVPEVKQQLRANTAEAIERGCFGVPTFVYEEELFWGQDRMGDLARRLSGQPAPPSEFVEEILARPRGADRSAADLGRRRPPNPPE